MDRVLSYSLSYINNLSVYHFIKITAVLQCDADIRGSGSAALERSPTVMLHGRELSRLTSRAFMLYSISLGLLHCPNPSLSVWPGFSSARGLFLR
jgi:hypothetical protein